jgi:hypothetical protein
MPDWLVFLRFQAEPHPTDAQMKGGWGNDERPSEIERVF